MFVFYDTETSGTSIAFDQILQFGAILTDSSFNELDRINVRCQLLPWVVPSPAALLVTNTPPYQLANAELPNFYEMVKVISEKLASWGQATFIGYNSINFDEPLLQRAFWLSLKPPFLTVTHGNSRFDILQFSRMLNHFRPDTITIPKTDTGRASFKLDRLAPENGFTHHNAHDAMGDVEATIYLAKTFATKAPDLWSKLIGRSSKKETNAILNNYDPVLIYDSRRNKRAAWFGLRCDDGRTSHATMLDLSYKWTELQIKELKQQENSILNAQAFSHIATNKAPLVFSLDEAKTMLQRSISSQELNQAEYLRDNPSFQKKLGELFSYTYEVDTQGKQLEELIFAGFPSASDEARMSKFWDAPADKRWDIAKSFQDARYRRLAHRMIYIVTPQLLSNEESEAMANQIDKRIKTQSEEPHGWRSIDDASDELSSIRSNGAFQNQTKLIEEIEGWLNAIAS